jgi:hypothetical protein
MLPQGWQFFGWTQRGSFVQGEAKRQGAIDRARPRAPRAFRFLPSNASPSWRAHHARRKEASAGGIAGPGRVPKSAESRDLRSLGGRLSPRPRPTANQHDSVRFQRRPCRRSRP